MFKKLKYITKQVLKFFLIDKLWAFFRQIYVNNKKKKTFALISTIKPLAVKDSPQYIVSLTSYGKRLTDTAPYAIVTLLNQNFKPDKIVLWVASEDKGNIPQIMEKLIERGLEIHFCEDIKSYTKLIPAFEKYPEDYIITADDDIYYPKNWLEQLLVEHKKKPKKIICHRAHGIKLDKDYNPIPYVKWDFCINPNEKNVSYLKPECVFPTGVGGILYPPKCFYKDLTNKELFMKLAPRADDIWFWAMAMINKEYFGEESPYVVVESGHSRNMYSIDPEQEKGGNALRNYNWAENGNDKQLKAVIEQYPQIREVLKKIKT